MQVEFTTRVAQWFEERNISSHSRSGSRIRNGDKRSFVDGLEVEPFVGFHAGLHLFQMGYMSYSNSQLPIKVRVGRYCSIAAGVNFILHNHPHQCLSTSIFSHDRSTDLTVRSMRHFLPDGKRFGFVPNPQKPATIIEHDVWIGQSSTLASGIVIGVGSIVAANSVVTQDVEPFTIVGGNPARIIRYRFPREIRERLLASNWWRFNYTDFTEMNIGDISVFLDQFEAAKGALREFNPPKIRIIDVMAVSDENPA